MSVKTGVAESEPDPKDRSSQLPASLTSVCAWLGK